MTYDATTSVNELVDRDHFLPCMVRVCTQCSGDGQVLRPRTYSAHMAVNGTAYFGGVEVDRIPCIDCIRGFQFVPVSLTVFTDYMLRKVLERVENSEEFRPLFLKAFMNCVQAVEKDMLQPDPVAPGTVLFGPR